MTNSFVTTPKSFVHSSGSMRTLLFCATLGATASLCGAQDWAMWGGDESRNMASTVKGLPGKFDAGSFKGATDEVDLSTTDKVKWVAKLGSQSYGNPTVSNGRIYVGTNNDSPRNPRYKGDRCVVYAFDEADGMGGQISNKCVRLRLLGGTLARIWLLALRLRLLLVCLAHGLLTSARKISASRS